MTATTPPPASTALYASRVKIHPKAVSGTFRRIKDVLGTALLAAFFLVPWLRWDRGAGAPDQAILFDPVGQRGHVFGLDIWPQDFHYLAGVLVIGVAALFLTASVAGRVWCGFACPQTVFTDLFIRIERLVEGERAARLRLDKAPLTAGKALRRTVKHALWLVVAAAFGATVSFYLIDAPSTALGYLTLSAPGWALGVALTFTASTYLLGGWAREQFCNYMCPWPRIQSSMLDDRSLVVTYQAWRGDRRGPKRKSQDWTARKAAGLGDCIDCGQCVQACPIGIDIRQGVNADCINCGLCIDACDDIMTRMDLPPRLIRFDSFAAARARDRAEPAPPVVRPRVVAVFGALGVAALALAVAFVLRPSLDVTALKERAPLFVAMSDGSIRNGYTLKINNKTREPRALALALDGGGTLSLLADDGTSAPAAAPVTIAPDTTAAVRLFVQLPRTGTRPDAVTLTLRDAATGETVREDLAFTWPGGGA